MNFIAVATDGSYITQLNVRYLTFRRGIVNIAAFNV